MRAAFCGALLWSFGATGLLGQPVQTRWKQSIDRPSRGWDYDGRRILGHVGNDICLWNATTGQLIARMKGHRERIQAVQLGPRGDLALTSSWISPGPIMLESKDTRTILWDLKTGKERHVFEDQVAGEFSADGKRIVTFSRRPEELSSFDAVVWDVASGRRLAQARLDDGSNPYWDALHFSPDGRQFVHVECGAFLAYNGSEAVLFDGSDGREIGRATARRANGAHRYTSRGALAAFGAERARLIDIKSGETIKAVEHQVKSSWGGAWTHDGRKVVSIPYNGSIQIWDMDSQEVITGANGGTYPQRVAIVSPDNQRLAIKWGGANDVEPAVGVYDMNTGESVARLKVAPRGRLLGFSPDSKTLLIGGSEFAIYDSGDGRKIRTLDLLGIDGSD